MAGVLGALFTLGIFQYRWMLISVRNEEEQQLHGLMAAVTRTIAGEFRRLAKELRPAVVPSGDEELKRTVIDGFYGSSFSESAEPVITARGIILEGGKTCLLYNSEGWSSEIAVPPKLLPMIRQWGNPESARSSEILFLISPPSWQSPSYILRPPSTSPGKGLFLEIDFSNFLQNHLLPALEEALPPFTISFQAALPDLSREARGFVERPRRRGEGKFSPWKALFSPEKKGERYEILLGSGRIVNQEGGNHPHFQRLSPLEGEDWPIGGLLVLEGKGPSLLRQSERRVVLNWLLGQLLLLGVGGTFVLILLQGHRLKIQRHREREFVASITHELRTPLTVLQTAADNIRGEIVPAPKLPRYGELMAVQIGRLSKMIEGLLLFSRLEGRTEESAESQWISGEEIEVRLEERIPPEEDGGPRSSRVSFDFGGLPKRFQADPDGLDLILGNLLVNALVHAHNPGFAIRILGRSAPPNRLIFTVEDDGPGVPSKEQKKIFSPFYRGERSRREQFRGSGLGLYLAAQKARIMGGSLNLESPYERVGQRRRRGCRFTLSLTHQKLEEGHEETDTPHRR